MTALEQMRQLHADASDLVSCCHPIADVQERAGRLMRALEETRRVSARIHSAGRTTSY